MRTLYLECKMGMAGDMLTAALLELHPDRDAFLKKMNEVLGSGFEIYAEDDSKCGVKGTHIHVIIDGHEECDGSEFVYSHHHSTISDILYIIESTALPEKVKTDAKNVFMIIAEAESRVHSMPVEQIHFHEVGNLDAIADVLNVCALINDIAPDKIMASPVNIGSGTVKCAHGILPVPAPATEIILRGIPVYSGTVQSELCTPTGAALLKYFVTEFGQMPVIMVEKTGYGTGTKDFEQANIVRAVLGETEEEHGNLIELACNLDDMTAEELGFAMDELFSLGALDVYFTNIGMKKNRPGVMLTCMCRAEDKDKFLKCIFKNTTTLGIREYSSSRYSLSRRIENVETGYGNVCIKVAEGLGVKRAKAEYEDIAKIARTSGKSLYEVKKEIFETIKER